MRLARGALILRDGHAADASELRSGTLVSVVFAPGNDKPLVRQISILALPGTDFIFSGRIEFLDLARGMLVLVDPRDNKSYEIYFDSTIRTQIEGLHEGAGITASTTFDGRHYMVQSVTRISPSTP
jgi:hypothetical protein